MKRFGSQLHKKAQGIKLSAAERKLLRERIVSYMEYHPLPKDQQVSQAATPELVSEPYRTLKVNYTYLSGVLGAMAVLVLVVVPVVAERAVPGDALYPVKVQFNEEVRSTLSFSPYAKVEWETKRLERRLAEARLLADEGKLTQEIEAEVAEAVQAHSEAAQQEIAVIRSNDSDEAAIAEIAFASVLEVQTEVLESHEEQADEEGTSVSALVEAVAEAHSGVEASNEAADPAYEKLSARLEVETTRAQEFFTSIQADASADEVKDIERRFEDISRKIAEAAELHTIFETASTSFDTEPELEAKQLLKTALRDTRKLISFMTDIDVRNNVTIEALVPVTLTAEERQRALTLRINELTIFNEELEQMVVDESLEEKFVIGKEQFVELFAVVTEAQAEGDLTTAEERISEAESIAADLQAMGDVLKPIDPVVEVDPEVVATSTEPSATTTDEVEIEIEPEDSEPETEIVDEETIEESI